MENFLLKSYWSASLKGNIPLRDTSFKILISGGPPESDASDKRVCNFKNTNIIIIVIIFVTFLHFAPDIIVPKA